MGKKLLCMRIPEDDLTALHLYAKGIDTTYSEIFRKVVHEYVSNPNKMIDAIKEKLYGKENQRLS